MEEAEKLWLCTARCNECELASAVLPVSGAHMIEKDELRRRTVTLPQPTLEQSCGMRGLLGQEEPSTIGCRPCI